MESNIHESQEKIVSFVTGANGFVGSHLVDYLLDLGHEVHGIVRATSNLQWLEGKAVTLHKCGLENIEALTKAMEGAHYIYHTAGVVKVPTLEAFMKGNVTMTKNVMEAAAQTPTIKRVLVVSSMAATGHAEYGGDVDETSPLRPIELYGDSKVAQEKVTREYEGKVPFTIVRPPGIYGPRDTEIYAMFKIFNKGIIPVMGAKPQEMSLIYVHDLVEGMYLAATNEKSVNEVYFLGSLERYNIKEIGTTAAQILNKKTWTIKIPLFVIFIVGWFGQIFESWFKMNVDLNKDRAFRLTRPSWYCNCQKAVDQLGFQQKYSLEEGFKITIDWYKENGWMKK